MPTVSHQISGASSVGGYSEMSYESADYEEEEDRFDSAAPEPIAANHQTSDMVLEMADLVHEQEGAIVSMSELFGCPIIVASVLLRKYNWNTEKLIEKFMDDPDAVLTEAGLDAEIKPMRQGSGKHVLCGICFEDVSLQTSSACAQSHRFCNDCRNGYLVSQIGDGGALTIKCMQPKCPALVEPALVQALVDAPTCAAPVCGRQPVHQVVPCRRLHQGHQGRLARQGRRLVLVRIPLLLAVLARGALSDELRAARPVGGEEPLRLRDSQVDQGQHQKVPKVLLAD